MLRFCYKTCYICSRDQQKKSITASYCDPLLTSMNRPGKDYAVEKIVGKNSLLAVYGDCTLTSRTR